jgi:hypothetical protein
LFPYTLENEASTWFFSLEEASMFSWKIFETIFLEKFREYKTPTTPILYLSRIKMDPKEKIKYFNQRFLNLMKKIPQASKPSEDVSIEFYTLDLPMSMDMFVFHIPHFILSIHPLKPLPKEDLPIQNHYL